MSKAEKIQNFDPSGVGNTQANIFGLPFTTEEADVVIIPVPWDVTVSSQEGTALGPENVFKQSFQIDLYDDFVKDGWKAGIAMESLPRELGKRNRKFRKKAARYIQYLESGGLVQHNHKMQEIQNQINQACEDLSQSVEEKATAYFQQNKLVVLLGGDHSTPLGLIKALTKVYPSFGILQIDAHADLRIDYEGFCQSHASIMYNALKIPQVQKLTQVGIRDFCQQEKDLIDENPHRIHTFFARDLHRMLFEGRSWKTICEQIIASLPKQVYISFDIDGLDPAYCASTGTPVPGGLTFDQVLFLFEELVKHQKQIIGFDLVETGPEKLDGIVACRLLYRMTNMMLKTHNRV